MNLSIFVVMALCQLFLAPTSSAFQTHATHSRTSTSSLHASSFFFPPPATPAPRSPSSARDDPTFIPPDPAGDFSISDPDCISAASLMRRILVPVPPTVNPKGEVGISYIHWPSSSPTTSRLPPILLVPGFDSSCLEFRRLGPLLSRRGVDVYAVDLLGWGFTELPPVDATTDDADYSATAKLAALRSFWTALNGGDEGREVVVGGASLGGAAAIEFAAAASSPAAACVLLDAQGFVDGVGPVVSRLPRPLARWGVRILKSEPLRESANQMSYFDKERYATEDALKVGRIHCLREGWEEGMMNFMTSGGFRPKEKVKDITQRSCVIWGRQDGILDGNEFANKFMETLPNEDNELHWIEECGHVPHLEQPEKTANVIYEFMTKGTDEKTAADEGVTAWEASRKFVLDIFGK